MSKQVKATKRKAENSTWSPVSNRTNKTLSSKITKLDINEQDSNFSVNKENLTKNEGSFWLMKSEPESRIENGHEMKFSFEDLKSSQDQITHWDGVRNYEARNHMKSMKIGEQAFFYHSNCKNPGIIGIVKICKEAYVDHTQFDPKDAHYDPKSDKNNPKWMMVDVKYERDLKRFIPLSELKEYHLMHKKNAKGAIVNLALFTRSRLSVQSIKKEEWEFIVELENKAHL